MKGFSRITNPTEPIIHRLSGYPKPAGDNRDGYIVFNTRPSQLHTQLLLIRLVIPVDKS